MGATLKQGRCCSCSPRRATTATTSLEGGTLIHHLTRHGALGKKKKGSSPMKASSFLAICLVIFTSGCRSSEREPKNVEAEKQKWQAQGWKFVETVGSPTEGAEYICHFSSSTADKVGAFGTAKPAPIKKEYKQDKAIFLIVTMGTDRMHTFVQPRFLQAKELRIRLIEGKCMEVIRRGLLFYHAEIR